MTASEHIQLAIGIIGRHSSPYQQELITQLQHLRWAAMLHEGVIASPVIPPRETCLGHKPCGVTVAGHSVATDAALEALDGGD